MPKRTSVSNKKIYIKNNGDRRSPMLKIPLFSTNGNILTANKWHTVAAIPISNGPIIFTSDRLSSHTACTTNTSKNVANTSTNVPCVVDKWSAKKVFPRFFSKVWIFDGVSSCNNSKNQTGLSTWNAHWIWRRRKGYLPAGHRNLQQHRHIAAPCSWWTLIWSISPPPGNSMWWQDWCDIR